VSIPALAARRAEEAGSRRRHAATKPAMRYMIIVRATPHSEAAEQPAPDEALMRAMADYHQQLAQAGVLLDAAGLQPSRKGWRVQFRHERASV